MNRTLLLVVVLAACSSEAVVDDGESAEVVARRDVTTTKIRVNGESSDAILDDPNTGTSGFVNVGRDNVAGTTSLDFSYATPTPDPDIITLVQGAGEIPNDAYTTSSTTANLTLESTPFPVIHCEVNLITAEFTCVEGPSIAWNLTWEANGFAEVEEHIKRIEKIGPLTIRSKGGYHQRSALVNGTWNGNTADDMMGNLLDTRSLTIIREITMAM